MCEVFLLRVSLVATAATTRIITKILLTELLKLIYMVATFFFNFVVEEKA